jgi:hypothetical protein
VIDDPPLVEDPAAVEALLGLLSTMRRLDALLLRDAEAPPSPTPLAADDPVLEAALGLVSLRRRLGGALALAADGAPELPVPPAPGPPLRDLLR